MLQTRLLTAIVLIPIVAALIYLGGLPYIALVAAVAAVAEFEFTRLLGRGGFRAVHLTGVVIVGLCMVDVGLPNHNLWERGLPLILMVSLAWQVIRYPRSEVGEWTGPVASGLYVGTTASYLVRLRTVPRDGLCWTLLVVAVTLMADTAAYGAGFFWGKHKLSPQLSPGKTVEGHLAGIIMGGVTGGAFGWLYRLGAGPEGSLRTVDGLLVGLLIAALAPLGDLAVSMAKREAGVEDSGKLLPGHGGLLDRVDSLLFAAVLGHTYLAWFVN